MLDDTSDEEDMPTDYELLLSSLKPLQKKPRLDEAREEEKDTEMTSVGDNLSAKVKEGGGEISERVESRDSDSETCHSAEADEATYRKGADIINPLTTLVTFDVCDVCVKLINCVIRPIL